MRAISNYIRRHSLTSNLSEGFFQNVGADVYPQFEKWWDEFKVGSGRKGSNDRSGDIYNGSDIGGASIGFFHINYDKKKRCLRVDMHKRKSRSSSDELASSRIDGLTYEVDIVPNVYPLTNLPSDNTLVTASYFKDDTVLMVFYEPYNIAHGHKVSINYDIKRKKVID